MLPQYIGHNKSYNTICCGQNEKLGLFTSTSKLPYELRMKIWNYKDNGYKNKDIVDLVEDEAEPHVSSKQQLVRCVGSIAGKHTMGQKPRRTTIEKN